MSDLSVAARKKPAIVELIELLGRKLRVSLLQDGRRAADITGVFKVLSEERGDLNPVTTVALLPLDRRSV